MADEKYPIGTRVKVKSGLYVRYIGNDEKDDVRLYQGQSFVVDEHDTLNERSDSDLLVEIGNDAPEAPATAEGSEPDAWGEDVDLEGLTEQLKGLNVEQAKQFLSRVEWTYSGMEVAKQAEASGKDRESISDYIDGRLLELEEETDDEQAGE